MPIQLIIQKVGHFLPDILFLWILLLQTRKAADSRSHSQGNQMFLWMEPLLQMQLAGILRLA
jgi:hypothetical protein